MQFQFTIGTPVYNRAHLLPRLYSSLLQNHAVAANFEWLLIDDGSTDDIQAFVEQVKADNIIPFSYIKKSNEGKHSCLNFIFKEARGELIIVLDSDDLLAESALSRAQKIWQDIENKQNIAGIIGLCTQLNKGDVLGDKFPSSPMYSTIVANAYQLNMRGDRCDFVRSDLLKNKRFPIIAGEKFMPEALITLDFDIDYKYLCVNDTFKIVEYQQEGISNNFAKLCMNNPKGLILRFERMLREDGLLKQINFKSKIKMYGNYTRYLLHDKQPILKKLTSLKIFYPAAFIIGCILGSLLFVKDIATIKDS
ncbi:glycosyltransferase family A protein [Thalassotalea fusca]